MSAAEDLRAKTDDQLEADLVELKREQFNLRFQAATNQIERPARIREVRRGSRDAHGLQALPRSLRGGGCRREERERGGEDGIPHHSPVTVAGVSVTGPTRPEQRGCHFEASKSPFGPRASRLCGGKLTL